MKQDHWIDLNIHQLKYKENEKKKQAKGNEILLIRQILQRERESSVWCIIIG